MRRSSQALSDKNLEAFQQKLDILKQDNHSNWQTYECKLVTPLYGGGVEAGKIDLQMPIRASAIRGHLRFWWRVRYGNPKDSKATFQKECEIWGGIGKKEATKSKVAIKVSCSPVKQDSLATKKEYNKPGQQYALGPAGINNESFFLKENYQFTIHLKSSDEVADQVEQSLRWWVSFGGLGARTRRGFGSITSKNISPITFQEIEEIQKIRPSFQIRTLNNTSKDPLVSWDRALSRLLQFRQIEPIKDQSGKITNHIGIGRKFDTNKQHRSNWPEADQIRRFTRKDDNGRHRPEHPAGNIFPRAAFGLPIQFKFAPCRTCDDCKFNEEKKEKKDHFDKPFKTCRKVPQTLTLAPKNNDRLASPLILKAYYDGTDGTSWLPIALLLPHYEDAFDVPLALKGKKDIDTGYKPSSWNEYDGTASLIDPIKKQKGKDPLTAFLDFFEKGN